MQHNFKQKLAILWSIIYVSYKVITEFKGKAYDSQEDACLYLTSSGKKCALGLFIPDGHKAQDLRGGSYDLLNTYPELINYMPSKNKELLSEFQYLHDKYASSKLTKSVLIEWWAKKVWEYEWI